MAEAVNVMYILPPKSKKKVCEVSREAPKPLGRPNCPIPAARAGVCQALPKLCFRAHHEANLPSCPAQTAELLGPGGVTGAWGQRRRPQVGKVRGGWLQGPGQMLCRASRRPGAHAGLHRPQVPGEQAALTLAWGPATGQSFQTGHKCPVVRRRRGGGSSRRDLWVLTLQDASSPLAPAPPQETAISRGCPKPQGPAQALCPMGWAWPGPMPHSPQQCSLCRGRGPRPGQRRTEGQRPCPRRRLPLPPRPL